MSLEQLRLQVSQRLLDLECVFENVGVPMPNLTLIARDPNNDEIFICVSCETTEGLEKAFELARGERQ